MLPRYLLALLLLGCLIPARGLTAQATATPAPAPVGTMSEIMIHVLYPASDAIFYIETRTPTTSEEWMELEMKALMLAETGNLLMTPERAWDDGQWMRDAMLLREAGRAAFEAVRARDVQALIDLNDQLYQSCVTCHGNYRPDYGRRPAQQ
jgi:hypothetical protein